MANLLRAVAELEASDGLADATAAAAATSGGAYTAALLGLGGGGCIADAAAGCHRAALQLVGHPDPAVGETALGYCAALPRLPLAAGGGGVLLPAVFEQLLPAVVAALSYPADDEPAPGTDGWPSGSVVDEGAWARRRRAAGGLVADCCGVLGGARSVGSAVAGCHSECCRHHLCSIRGPVAR